MWHTKPISFSESIIVTATATQHTTSPVSLAQAQQLSLQSGCNILWRHYCLSWPLTIHYQTVCDILAHEDADVVLDINPVTAVVGVFVVVVRPDCSNPILCV